MSRCRIKPSLLPADYGALTSDGKRQARLNAAGLNRKLRTPEEFADAWSWFCDYYLNRQIGKTFLPPEFFYPEPKLPTPVFHREMVEDLKRYKKNVFAFPRYSGKSIVIGTTVPLWLSLIRPSFKTLIILNTHTQAAERMDNLIGQLVENPIIFDEFGKMKPLRGEKIWNRGTITLNNRSKISGVSLGSKKHGHHPHLLISDDCESDPDSASKGLKDPERLFDELSHEIFNVLLPMRPMCFAMIGTLLTVKSLIHHAATTQEDKRWFSWNRKCEGIYKDVGKKRIFLWKERYDQKFVKEEEEALGMSAFNAQYMNRPGSSLGSVLHIDDTYHLYRAEEGLHPYYDTDPLNSQTTITYNRLVKHMDGSEGAQQVRETAGGPDGMFTRMFRFLTVDPARTQTKKSDWSCVMVMGRDADKRLWILDNWLGKVSEETLVQQIFRLGYKWRVPVIGIESTSIQMQFTERAHTDLIDNATKRGWPVRVVALKTGTQSKSDRVAGMSWRFLKHYVQLPGDLKDDKNFKPLFFQIEHFTHDFKHLAHDDAVDAMSLHQLFPQMGLGRRGKSHKGPIATPIQHLRNGELESSSTGMPFVLGVNASEISDEMLELAYKRESEETEQDEDRGVQYTRVGF